MDSYKDHCVLAVRNNNADDTRPCSLIICNDINTTVDCKTLYIFIYKTLLILVSLFCIAKHINFEPIWITMNGTHVIVSSYTSFMTWQYTVPKSHSTSTVNGKLLMYTAFDMKIIIYF